MFYIGAVILFWVVMFPCIMLRVIFHDDDAYPLNDVLWRGIGVIVVVDLIWALLMAFRYSPAWRYPKTAWSWVDQYITEPWIGPQVAIVILIALYALVTEVIKDMKSAPKK